MTKKDRYNVKAGWLLDGSGAPARHRVFLQIAEGRIVRIDAAENAPPQGRFLDFGADTVLPCLVDSHVHLFMSGTTDPQARKQQLCADCNEARTAAAASKR